jgi:hypothetical protein
LGQYSVACVPFVVAEDAGPSRCRDSSPAG